MRRNERLVPVSSTLRLPTAVTCLCVCVRPPRPLTAPSCVNIGRALSHLPFEWLDEAPLTGAFGLNEACANSYTSEQPLANTHVRLHACARHSTAVANQGIARRGNSGISFTSSR